VTEQRWLIRTRSKQILGPASKEKIVSLLEKQSLNDEDELSSGNGYWFWVKEKDLVEKYLYSSEPQGFNPVTESKSVLSSEDAIPVKSDKEVKLEVPAPEVKKVDKVSESDDVVIPPQEDLEFPDMGFNDDGTDEEIALDHTSVISLDELSSKPTNTNQLNESLEVKSELNVLDKTKETKVPSSIVKDEPIKKSTKLKKKKEVIQKTEEIAETEPVNEIKKTRNDRYLFLLLMFICLVLFCVFYYYRTIINKPIPIIGISNARAQAMTSLVKKKVLLI
jgi:hypothetical protein